MVIIQQSAFFIQRIVWRNHKPNLIQIRMLSHVIGNNEMSNMNGVKSAEIQSYFHCLFCFAKIHKDFYEGSQSFLCFSVLFLVNLCIIILLFDKISNQLSRFLQCYFQIIIFYYNIKLGCCSQFYVSFSNSHIDFFFAFGRAFFQAAF